MARNVPPIRVYADTSVFGGVFDAEFSEATNRLFAQIRAGEFRLVHSVLIELELTPAPERVRAFFQSVRGSSETVDISDQAVDLRERYLEAGIVSPSSETDALHVAIATIARCPIIVSWNFKHIVHQQKIPLYNDVNVRAGYATIQIHSPPEVIWYDEEGI